MSRMTTCKACGAIVSKTAETCPQCGAVLKVKAGCISKLLLLLIIVVGIGIWSNKEKQAAKYDTPISSEDTPISSITLADLEKSFSASSDLTDLQKKETWKQYDRKKVKWTGKVYSIHETFGTIIMHVKMNPLTLTSDAAVSLNESERGKALKLKEGDRVTFIAVLADWSSILEYDLDTGEIVQE